MSEEPKKISFKLPDPDEAVDASSQIQISGTSQLLSRLSEIEERLISSHMATPDVINNIGRSLEVLGNAILKMYQANDLVQPMLGALKQISAGIAESVAAFSIPGFSEEKRKKILESYKRWGRYGWVVLLNAPMKYYYEPPLNIEDANKKALKYCTDADMEQTFDELKNTGSVRTDLESAILCFRTKQYKPCALLLFGLIDAKLIRKQKQTSSWRKVGSGAVVEFKKRVEADEKTKMFFTMLCYANLIAYFETVFASANNFKNEPAIINRNFVDHGMSNRRVRKRDCIQLFLALYNFLRLTDDKQ